MSFTVSPMPSNSDAGTWVTSITVDSLGVPQAGALAVGVVTCKGTVGSGAPVSLGPPILTGVRITALGR